MAGDWIKMRGNLWDDPRVAALVDITDSSEAAVIGGLYWLWSTADQHTEDGLMPGLTLRQIDRKTGVIGLGKALCEIGWLAETDGGVCLQNFTEHNGASAKRRATEAQRKANSRKPSAPNADNQQTEDGQAKDEIRQLAELEKEKRREEINTNTPLPPKGGGRDDAASEPEGFAAFYELYQRKDAKQDAIKAWRQLKPSTELLATILTALRCWRWNDDRTKNPLPASWLRGRRWEDEAVRNAAAPTNSTVGWWTDAGFPNRWEAENVMCWEHTAHQFRNGHRVEEVAA